MKAKNISYPHPVVGNEDDMPGSIFKPRYFRHALGRDSIPCKIGFDLKNKTIEDLIAKKKAKFTVEMECNSTFFRTLFSTFDREAEFALDANRVREMVAAAFYVRAVEPIPGYVPKGCHPDYDGFKFEIGPGDVLAVGGFTSFIAEKDFDPLRPSVTSLITINGRADRHGPMIVNYADNEKIIIKLADTDWSRYRLVKGRKSAVPVLHATIVLPVLADAIRLVQKDDDETRNAYWFQRLKIILEQKRMMEKDPLTAAQDILKNPVERALGGIVEIGQEDE